jgi:hypothetical protein
MDKVVLFTYHKENLCSFLVHIFDMDVQVKEQGISLDHEHFRFKICDAKDRPSMTQNNTMVELMVDSPCELEYLRQKMEFFKYRINQDSCESPEEIEFRPNESLTFADPDGRRWKFTTLDDSDKAVLA